MTVSGKGPLLGSAARAMSQGHTVTGSERKNLRQGRLAFRKDRR